MRKFILLPIVIILFSIQNLHSDNIKIELIKTIHAGDSVDSIRFGFQPKTTSCFAIGDATVIVPDIWRNRFNIYDLNFNFIKEVQINPEIKDILSVIRIEFLDNKILTLSNRITSYKLDGILFFEKGPYVTTENDIFKINDILCYYAGDNTFAGIDKLGNLLTQKEIIDKLYEIGGWQKGVFTEYQKIKEKVIQFLEENNLIFYNDQLYAWEYDKYHKTYFGLINQVRKIKHRPADDDYLFLIGYDSNSNSYWQVQDRLSHTVHHLYVIDKYGEIIKRMEGVLEFTASRAVQVRENGDVYIMKRNSDEKYLAFYRIKNTWDPIKAGVSSQSPAVKPVPAASGTAVKVSSLTASSFIDYQSMYTPAKVFDSDSKTAWLEAAKSSGFNEKITLTLDKDITVDEIRFEPGYFDPKWWKTNNRIKKLAVLAGDKAFSVDFADKMEEQTKKLDAPITFTSITFSIKDIFRSTGDDDTALSEVAFYFKGKKIELDLSGVKP